MPWNLIVSSPCPLSPLRPFSRCLRQPHAPPSINIFPSNQAFLSGERAKNEKRKKNLIERRHKVVGTRKSQWIQQNRWRISFIDSARTPDNNNNNKLNLILNSHTTWHFEWLRLERKQSSLIARCLCMSWPYVCSPFTSSSSSSWDFPSVLCKFSFKHASIYI